MVKRSFIPITKDEALNRSYSLSQSYNNTIYNMIEEDENILYVLIYNDEDGFNDKEPLHIDYNDCYWGTEEFNNLLDRYNLTYEWAGEYIIFIEKKNEE